MVERKPKVHGPNVYPECENCGFSSRATLDSQRRFYHAETITITCSPNASGGATQVEPKKFIEFQSRTIKATPDTPSDGYLAEFTEGHITTCPHDIPESDKKYSSQPQMKYVTTDISGKTHRS